jgi:hypothetical protein
MSWGSEDPTSAVVTVGVDVAGGEEVSEAAGADDTAEVALLSAESQGPKSVKAEFIKNTA